MAFDPLTDYILTFFMNMALIAGCFWVLLRFLEQCIKVWHLYKEEEVEG